MENEMSKITVKFAVYGALYDNDPNISLANDVKFQLQNAIDSSSDGLVVINNESMGSDPCPLYLKGFGATIIRDEVLRYYVCTEGQTVNFRKSG
jgi:hypothetical protein